VVVGGGNASQRRVGLSRAFTSDYGGHADAAPRHRFYPFTFHLSLSPIPHFSPRTPCNSLNSSYSFLKRGDL
jgi:hypothetical protein